MLINKKVKTIIGWVILLCILIIQFVSIFPSPQEALNDQLRVEIEAFSQHIQGNLSEDEKIVEDLSPEYPLFLFSGKKLIYWNSSYYKKPDPRSFTVDTVFKYEQESGSGLMLGFRKGDLSAIGMIPVIENDQLVLEQNLFRPNFKKESKISVGHDIQFDLKDVQAAPQNKWWLSIQILLIVLASILIFPHIYHSLQQKVTRFLPSEKISWLILLALLFIPSCCLPGFDTLWISKSPLPGLFILSPLFLFILSLLLLLVLSNIKINEEKIRSKIISEAHKHLLAFGSYFGISLMGLIMVFAIQKSYHFNDIDLKLDQLFTFSFQELAFLIFALLAFINFFTFSQLLYGVVKASMLSLTHKLVAVFINLGLFFVISPMIIPGFDLYMLILAFLIFIISLDLYHDRKSLNSSWVFTWMILISAFVSFIVFNVDYQSDQQFSENQMKHTLKEREPDLEKLMYSGSNNIPEDLYFSEWKAMSEKELSAFKNNMLDLNEGLYFNPLSGDYLMAQESLRTVDIPVRFFFRKNTHTSFHSHQGFQYLLYEGEKLLSKRVNSLFPIDFAEDLSRSDLINDPPNGFRAIVTEGHSDLSIVHFSRKPGLLRATSLFSLLFFMLSLFLFIISWINQYYSILPGKTDLILFSKKSLRNRIQMTIISLVIVSFFIIALITNHYLGSISQRTNQMLQSKEAQLFQREINNITQSDQWEPVELALMDLSIKKKLEEGKKIHLFDQEGSRLTDPRHFTVASNEQLIPQQIPFSIYKKMKRSDSNISFVSQDRDHPAGIFIPVSYSPNEDNKGYAFIAKEKLAVNELSISDIFASFLNIYSILFILAAALAIMLANSITKPIEILGSKLKSIKLANKNEVVEWKNKDEIGALISIYNEMIHKLSDNARVMAKVERDSAWKEMAKQVAHEIKNPLTPLKLNIQYLESKVRMSPDEAPKLIEQIAPSLIEQIDNLSEIASEFSNFAQLPNARNEKIRLNEIVKTVHDFFRKREDLIFQLFIPINDVLVFADRNHLVRILNNVVKNAIQSIPSERKGEIIIRLFRKEDNAIVQVTDNGSGIPEEMRDKVFSPNFTTKSSGTGLGLAISTNMLESCNGRIYFETVEGEGTDFFIEIPLMRLEDNYPESKRVMLDD